MAIVIISREKNSGDSAIIKVCGVSIFRHIIRKWRSAYKSNLWKFRFLSRIFMKGVDIAEENQKEMKDNKAKSSIYTPHH